MSQYVLVCETRNVGWKINCTMSGLQLFPPLYDENEHFKKVISQNKIDQTETENTVENLLKSVNERLNFLSNHPMPFYQGPFTMPMGLELLKKSFKNYTTFKHSHMVNCGFWNAVNKNIEPKDQIILEWNPFESSSSENVNLVGPASKLDKTLIYPCEIGHCQISCACSICTNLRHSKDSFCIGTSHYEQCRDHRIGVPRTFHHGEDLFTLVASKGDANDESNLVHQTMFIIRKYTDIPKSCEECRCNLRDHEVHHKVFNTSCKFCEKDFRLIEDCMSKEDLRRKRDFAKNKDGETCSFCFKLFATKFTRKRHEQSTHGGGFLNCLVCSRKFQSEASLKKHSDTYHKQSVSSFKCTLCEKILSTEEILKRHTATVHGRKVSECDMCAQKFTRRNHYVRHLRDVHSTVNKVNLTYAVDEYLYNFKCSLCDERFRRKETLKRHVSTVHGEAAATFECKICSKQFNRDDNRKRHELVCSKSI